MTQALEDRIRAIIAGLPPDGRLPSERTLAAQFGAGRTTVRLVLTRLSAEGAVRAEHGRGYFVVRPD